MKLTTTTTKMNFLITKHSKIIKLLTLNILKLKTKNALKQPTN